MKFYNGKAVAEHAPTGVEVRALIYAARQEEGETRAQADKVRDIVATFEGKQIGKRLTDKVEAALGDALVHLQKESYGAWTLFVWDGNTGRKYDNRLMFFIPGDARRESEGWATMREGFEKSNISVYAGADERQELRMQALESQAPEELADAVTRYHIARAELKNLVTYKKPLSPDEFKFRSAFDYKT